MVDKGMVQQQRGRNDNVDKDEWLEEYFPKQMEVYHHAIEQTKEQILNQLNL